MACFLLNLAYTHFLLFCNHITISFCFRVVDNPTNPCGHLSCPPNSRCIVGTNGTAKCACAKNSCPQLNEFVCGSNGKTYRNTCEMEYDSCDSNETITAAHKGHCRSKWSQMAISICVIVLLLWSAPLAYLHLPSSSNSFVSGNFVKRFQNSGLNKFVNGYDVLSFGKRRVSCYFTLKLIPLLIFLQVDKTTLILQVHVLSANNVRAIKLLGLS